MARSGFDAVAWRGSSARPDLSGRTLFDAPRTPPLCIDRNAVPQPDGLLRTPVRSIDRPQARARQRIWRLRLGDARGVLLSRVRLPHHVCPPVRRLLLADQFFGRQQRIAFRCGPMREQLWFAGADVLSTKPWWRRQIHGRPLRQALRRSAQCVSLPPRVCRKLQMQARALEHGSPRRIRGARRAAIGRGPKRGWSWHARRSSACRDRRWGCAFDAGRSERGITAAMVAGTPARPPPLQHAVPRAVWLVVRPRPQIGQRNLL